MGGACTLETCAAGAVYMVMDLGCTLGDAVGVIAGSMFGIVWTRFNYVAKVRREFLTGSPASNFCVVVDGGNVIIVIISVAVWRKKSVNLISGNGTLVGKNVTVSQSLGVLVLGK